MKKAAILAAGEGSRIKKINYFKPIVIINGTPLIELTLHNLQFKNFDSICIIFNEEQVAMDLTRVPSLKDLSIDYFFKTTRSSMHSLLDVSQRLNVLSDEHVFISMVDSIVLPSDGKDFLSFCQKLNHNESALLATSFIEDENPLTLKVDNNGNISTFQCPIDKDVLVTSGVYFFSGNVFPLLQEMVLAGKTKMRTFLTELVEQNYIIKVFSVSKTLDIDRPEDVKSAEDFMAGLE